VHLAQVRNVDLNWLLNGREEMRATGGLSGAVFADILTVDHHGSGDMVEMEHSKVANGNGVDHRSDAVRPRSRIRCWERKLSPCVQTTNEFVRIEF